VRCAPLCGELGLPISIGVARHSTSDCLAFSTKPDGLVVVDPTLVGFPSRPARRVDSGCRSGHQALLAEAGIQTIGQLARCQDGRSNGWLVAQLEKAYGRLAWNTRPTEIKTHRRAHSVGAQWPSAGSLLKSTDRPTLRHLADRVATRLGQSPACRTVTVSRSLSDITRSRAP